MAPELWSLSPQDTSRVDQWAMGICIYNMIELVLPSHYVPDDEDVLQPHRAPRPSELWNYAQSLFFDMFHRLILRTSPQRPSMKDV
eukprot:9116087-Lingulodinium_polyedra.AAC.1